MARFELLGTATIPGKGTQLRLLQRNDEFSIRVTGISGELMNTRVHGSEDALAALACERIADHTTPKVLIGGLGMGFTLAAALQSLGETAEVTVAELVPEVAQWNLGPLGRASGYPLKDPRTRVYIGDAVQLIKDSPASYDAILLDIDNGPEGHTRKENGWLYTSAGIEAAREALRPDGILAYWSAGQAPAFTERLKRAGLTAEAVTVRAHRPGKGAKHVIWLAW
ncbi:MAG: spermidine synthase [Marinobacter sp.]|uniref:spermidine synthase n=1 Tax=Marinobacter sp. TaxID=50741 RepID=UPI003F9D9122